MEILLAYDGTDPSRHALEMTAELAQKLGAAVSVLSVVPVRRGRAPMDPWDDHQVHVDELLEARQLLREKGVEPTLVERFGDPATTIEKTAARGDFDLVVIGSRGLNLLSRVFQGSVSEHVATHAPTTVLIAR